MDLHKASPTPSSQGSGSGFSRDEHFNPKHDAILRIECLSARRLKVCGCLALNYICFVAEAQSSVASISMLSLRQGHSGHI